MYLPQTDINQKEEVRLLMAKGTNSHSCTQIESWKENDFGLADQSLCRQHLFTSRLLLRHQIGMLGLTDEPIIYIQLYYIWILQHNSYIISYFVHITELIRSVVVNKVYNNSIMFTNDIYILNTKRLAYS